MNKTLGGRHRELKNKGKVQLGNPRQTWSRSFTGVHGRLQEILQSLRHGSNGVSQSWS